MDNTIAEIQNHYYQAKEYLEQRKYLAATAELRQLVRIASDCHYDHDTKSAEIAISGIREKMNELEIQIDLLEEVRLTCDVGSPDFAKVNREYNKLRAMQEKY